MKSQYSFDEKIPAIVINRMAAFFFLMSFFSVFLYVLVSRQGFQDETQYILLWLSAVLGLLLLILSIIGLILDTVIFIILKKRRYLLNILLFLVYAFFGGTISFAAYFILIVSGGNMNP